MAYNGMNWTTLNLPFRAGLGQKADDRARPQPFLDIAKDIQFDELGGIQTRYPFAAMSNAIVGGGTLANCRKLAVVNDELCVFTDVGLYSWNAQLTKWVFRGTHLAVSVDETRRAVTTGDQVDGDRAELNGTIIEVWTEGVGAATSVYAAAFDKATGSVLVSPTAISPAATFAGRPRLVALLTKILLFADDGGGNLKVRAIDPADPATGFASAGQTIVSLVFLGKYDVVQVDATDQCVGACNRNPTTSYTAFTVTAGLTIATATKARACDGPIAVASTPGGTQTQVVRGNGLNIQGDLLTTSTLADVFTNQAIGAVGFTINQIAAAFASTTTAMVFWSTNETIGSGFIGSFVTETNTVTTANVVGAQSVLARRLGVASRAFTRAGAVYVWLVFAEQSANAGTGVGLGIRGQLQNTYLLYRADGHIAAKAAWQIAGGYSPSAGHLPGVAPTSSTGNDFAWCGAFRRKVELGGTDHTGYSARSPVDITFSFDSNAARRTTRIGATMYVTGGVLLQYDGIGLYEVGFFYYPWSFATLDSGAAGNVGPGTFAWKSTWKWTNAKGETERSTTATGEQQTLAAAHFVNVLVFFLLVTRKLAPRAVTVEIWRTANASQESPFYLVTGQDPGVITGGNCYIPNDTTQDDVGIVDNFSDAVLTTKEQNPQNDGVLESLAPPAAGIAIATDTRIYLGNVAGDPDAVWYSRLRNEGEIASFHDRLRAFVPRDGGRMTALVIHNETLAVFRTTAIYRLPGNGLNNLGQGSNFEAFIVASDVGAISQEAVASIPLGTVFKSRKGWYLLTPSWQTQYIGAAVSDYDSETVLAIDVVETQHQVRILTSARMLVWDYFAQTPESPVGQWFEWSIEGGLDSVIWNGTHVYLTSAGPVQQQSTYTALTYGIDVETADIKLADLQGATRCRKVQPLGEYRSDCLVRTRIAYNYKRTGGVPDYVDDKAWTPSPAVVGGPLQFKHGPKRPICESIKVRFTACVSAVLATRATATFAIPVQTSGTNWTATFRAVAPGELGNAITLRIAFVVGVGPIDVRDHFAYDPVTATWSPAIGTIGVLVTGAPTVALLEAAIVAGTALATLTVADATPAKVVNVAAMAALAVVTGAFTGGAFGPPAGEAIKLTGLGLEVGTEQGLYNRLPAAQRQ